MCVGSSYKYSVCFAALAVNQVVASLAANHVVARAPVKLVVATFAVNLVFARTAKQGVVSDGFVITGNFFGAGDFAVVVVDIADGRVFAALGQVAVGLSATQRHLASPCRSTTGANTD